MTEIRTLTRRNPFTDQVFALAISSFMLLPMVALQEAKAADPVVAASADKKSDDSIRPFKIEVPQTQLDDLRKRIAHTRWPDN